MSWRKGPEGPVLRDGEVHVWRLGLDRVPTSAGSELPGLLAPEELSGARRFRRERDRERWLLARAFLRSVLSRYTAVPARDITFTQGPYGKPALAGQGPRFNLAHSDNLAVLALSLDGAIGADVERLRPLADLADIAPLVLTPEETRSLRRLEGPEAARVFISAWVRKEALAKAVGAGLHLPLARVSIPLETPASVLLEPGCEGGGRVWWVRDLPLGPGWAGALATARPVEAVRLWDY